MENRFLPNFLAALLLFTPLSVLGGSINPKILKQAVYTAARKQPNIPPDLMQNISHSLVRLYRQGEPKIVGTGFLLHYQKKLLVVLPHHIAGNQGRTWEIGLSPVNQKERRIPITITQHGGFDDNTPDLSVIDLSGYSLPPLQALEIGTPQMNRPAYSFGYTFGDTQPKYFLPLERSLLTEHGWQITTDRHLPAEIPGQPVNLAGYCGSPLLQRQGSSWKAVGIHLGSCVYGAENFKNNIAFAADLSKALPLVQNQVRPQGQPILFQGVAVDYLRPGEFIKSIEIERNGISVFWAAVSAHTDVRHLETLLEKETPLQTDDQLIILISNGTSDRLVNMPLP